MSALETAAQPQTLRRVAIDPVSRVEGHGKVTILLDDKNQVHQVRLHIVEFRGFEKFIEGRPLREMPSIMARICTKFDMRAPRAGTAGSRLACRTATSAPGLRS